MDRLPPELVLQVYQASTPNRRKALLGASKQISAGIRPWVNNCAAVVAGSSFPRLPDADRFPNLNIIRLRAGCHQARTLTVSIGAVLLAGNSDTTITITLCEGRRVTTIEGFREATFDVSKKDRVPEVQSIFRLCKGLEKASFIGGESEAVEVGKLRNLSLRHAVFQNVTFTTMETPALQKLEMVVEDCDVYLDCMELPELTDLTIHARALQPLQRWPSTIVNLTIFLTRPCAVVVRDLPLLERLHLVNVRGQVNQLDNCPELAWVKLDNSYIDNTPPEEIVAAGALHQSLLTLEIVALSPTALDLQEWGLLQRLYRAVGWCHHSAIRLCFEF